QFPLIVPDIKVYSVIDVSDIEVNETEPVAGADEENFLVHSIYGISISKSDNSVRYCVNWFGYSSELDTWEPYQNLDRMPAKVEKLNKLLFAHCQKLYFAGNASKSEEFWFRRFQKQFMESYTKSEDCQAEIALIKDGRNQGYNNDAGTAANNLAKGKRSDRRKRGSQMVSASVRTKGKVENNINNKVKYLKRFNCSACSKNFVYSSSLKRHIKCSHTNVSTPNSPDELSEKMDHISTNKSSSTGSISTLQCSTEFVESASIDGVGCNACRRMFRDAFTLNDHLGKCLSFRRSMCNTHRNSGTQTRNYVSCDAETQTGDFECIAEKQK
ncbi:unnamed protein product, partial [Allacma fusca]